MGSGKSTIGRLLASSLGCPFLDTDRLVAVAEGMSIQSIFDKKGEAYFREKESQLILKLSHKKPSVISLGGGAVLSFHNREIFKKGLWINFNTSTAILIQRLLRTNHRPLLLGNDREQKIVELYRQRFPFYAMAPVQIDNSGLSPRAVVGELLRKIRR